MSADHQSLAIGTYTGKLPRADGSPAGILGAAYDEPLTGLTVLAEQENPSWVTPTADGRYLYAVAETGQFGDVPGGAVAAYARDTATGAVTLLNTVSSGGADPAYLELDPAGRFVVVANYSGGSVAVVAREPGGRLGEMTCLVQHRGASVHPDRQTSPHPHQVVFDPVTGDVLIPDLGLDAVLVYRLGQDGALTERPEARIACTPGAGPRHAAFHPGGEHLFVLNELDSTLVVLRRAGDGFVRTCTVSTVPEEYSGENYPSAIRVSASGRSVLTANRGHDSIAVFGFDPVTGTAVLRLTEPVRGEFPRDFIVAPDGARVLVANTNSDTVALFAFEEEPPSLTFIRAAGAKSPACLRFLP